MKHHANFDSYKDVDEAREWGIQGCADVFRRWQEQEKNWNRPISVVVDITDTLCVSVDTEGVRITKNTLTSILIEFKDVDRLVETLAMLSGTGE
jgi:hypothetical protein